MLPFSFVSVLLVGWLYCWVVADEETKIVDVQGEPLTQGTDKGMAYANFVLHKFSFLNITSIGSNHVVTGSECGFACVDIPSCFSFNLAAFHDIDGKVLCELLPSDIFNNSDKQIPSQSHHHYSIAILTSAVLPSGSVMLMQIARTVMAPTAVLIKAEFLGMEKHVKEVPKDFRSNQEEKLQHHLTSQGFFFSNAIKYPLSSVNSILSVAQSHLPKNIYNFTIRYINNSLPTHTNGWTLIARFSNSDSKNWMHDDGKWWYDQQITVGATKNSSENNDMISTAFWSVSGSEIKITRSDDPSHTPLLQTTNNCLGGQAFRSKITSYGDFRNGTVWASDQCLGSCAAQYGGQYNSTDGFQKAECSGNIQSANKIGFWCDWSTGDGSVMKIGGGGSSCARADHGIGITETGDASFVDLGTSETEYDFGYDAFTNTAPSQSYSLNLWIR
ncbi:hypothetical protein AWC38_SpisGene19480 [Stylophora pistillata]|uniref:Apple domain-containing protein n=1 Tax=Stylophora pistillata TaxID=50429 RepID=A0A2B4RGH0_STYPI|nr:hypothetical protein AWC38_SpisGene19480 [Stylophora pistillata]